MYYMFLIVFQPLSKKIPENPKYKHVRATVDTGKCFLSIKMICQVPRATITYKKINSFYTSYFSFIFSVKHCHTVL